MTKNEPLEEARIKRAKQAVDTLTKSFDKIDHFLKTESMPKLLVLDKNTIH